MPEIDRPNAAPPHNPVERVLFETAGNQKPSRDTVNALVDLLKRPEFDWRDLARALGRMGHQGAAAHRFASADVATAARLAVLALRKATGSESEAALTAARLTVREACDPAVGPETMLINVFKALKTIIDFDIATFVEYQDSQPRKRATLLRARLAIDGDEPFTWPARWIEVDAKLIDLIKSRGPDRCIKDLEQFYTTQPGAQALKNNPVAKEYRRRKVHSVISTARLDGDRLWSGMSLARRADKPVFTPEELDRLDRLGLDRAMRLASEAFQTRQQALAADIANMFDVDGNDHPQALAENLVKMIGAEFGWDYVAIFRVARAREQIEVTAQYDATTDQRLTLPSIHSQPLAGPRSGMIGKARRLRRTLRARDVRPPEPRPKNWRSPHNYIRTNDAQVSAMCVPLFLSGEVEWVLDCESTQVDGFMQPDEDALNGLAREAERTLRLWFESSLNKALLDRVDQAVIVVDEKQQIERMNEAARKLLGGDRRGRKLAEFAADAATFRLLDASSALPGDGFKLAIRDGDERVRLVQASARSPQDTFCRRIWLFTEISAQRWGVVVDEMRQTVQDVAAQTRGPLLLAGALLRKAKRVVESSGGDKLVDGILDRAARSLTKTDMTYERLAASLEAINQPQRQARLTTFDLGSALQSVVASLPVEDGSAIDGPIPADVPAIRVDPERMAFALRSVLGYILAIRSDDQRLDLRAGSNARGVWLTASLYRDRDEPGERDRHPELAGGMQPPIGQALTAAKAIVESHGAQFLQSESSAGLEVSIQALPVSPSGTHSSGTHLS